MTNPQVAELIRAANDAQRAGRPADAERALKRALEVQPDNPVALNSLGMRVLEGGDAKAALAYFERATAADPAATALWMNLAKAQRLLGDSEGEGRSLDRALETDQRHLMALIRRAELHERLGEHGRGLSRWAGVLALTAQLDPVPPPLEEVIAHARRYVAEQTAAFESAIQGPIDAARGGLDSADRRRFDACIDHVLGKRAIYVNECAGLHFPFLPADEFFDKRLFPWLAALEAQTPAIAAEAAALLDKGAPGFAPYVSQDPGTPHNKWTALDNKMDWGAYFFWKYGERKEEAARLFPATAAALDAVPLAALPGRAPNAFFSVLKPRTRIPAHTGVTNTRAIVHLPLIVPEGCGFRVGGETRQWRVGEAFAFDDTIEHEAWNDSDEPRAILILDVWNPHINEQERTLIGAYYDAADASGFSPEPRGGG